MTPSFPASPGSPTSSFHLLPQGTAVVMPALDEAESVGAAVSHWIERGAHRVIVADNGSRDETAARAREAGARVICEERRGYGAAAWAGTGILPAGTKYILFASADGSDCLDNDSAAALNAAVADGAALVIGDRTFHPESRRYLTAVQRFGNRLCAFLIAIGWQAPVYRDIGSLRLIERTAFDRLALTDRSFGWNIEMQVRALENKLHLAEIPVPYRPRTAGQPKISGNCLGIFRAGRDILLMIARLWRGKNHGTEVTPRVILRESPENIPNSPPITPLPKQ